MTEIDRIQDQMRRAFEGDAWHGPSLGEILPGISAKQAAGKPLPGIHSIWEIVLHLMAWHDVVRRRLDGEVIDELPPNQNWPAVTDAGESAWRQASDTLAASHQLLLRTISQLRDERLNDKVAGKPYSIYVMLHGVVQHDLYHAGQIAILKKVQGQ